MTITMPLLSNIFGKLEAVSIFVGGFPGREKIVYISVRDGGGHCFGGSNFY